MSVPMTVAVVGMVVSLTTGTGKASTSGGDMKNVIKELYEVWINTGHLDGLDEVVSTDYVAPDGQRGAAAFRANIEQLRRGFPDIRFTVEDLVAEGDKVTVRWTWRGTHTGPFRAFQPTGHSITNSGIAIYQFVDGRIANVWLETDRLGVVEQLQGRQG
jgi:predicted ester cyclase